MTTKPTKSRRSVQRLVRLGDLLDLGWDTESAGPINPRCRCSRGPLISPWFPGEDNWHACLTWVHAQSPNAPASATGSQEAKQ